MLKISHKECTEDVLEFKKKEDLIDYANFFYEEENKKFTEFEEAVSCLKEFYNIEKGE